MSNLDSPDLWQQFKDHVAAMPDWNNSTSTEQSEWRVKFTALLGMFGFVPLSRLRQELRDA